MYVVGLTRDRPPEQMRLARREQERARRIVAASAPVNSACMSSAVSATAWAAGKT